MFLFESNNPFPLDQIVNDFIQTIKLLEKSSSIVFTESKNCFVWIFLSKRKKENILNPKKRRSLRAHDSAGGASISSYKASLSR